MPRASSLVLALALLSGCHSGPSSSTGGISPVATGASAAQIDSIWRRGMAAYTKGSWNKAATLFERITLELPAGDSRIAEAHFRLAEAYLGQKNHLQATREFRRVADDFPSDSLAPFGLLRAGDAYADLWGRPELDPTYGQTALATYQELLNRYSGTPAAARAQLRIAALNEKFARKEFKAAQYYLKLKAYDSAILYLKDLVATYPKSSVAPHALLKLVQAYHAIDYVEDLRETCGYIRQYHPGLTPAARYCPPVGDTT